MPNFYHISNVLDSNKKRIDLPKGSTPNDFKKIIVKGDFLLPTICVIHVKNQDPRPIPRFQWDSYVVGDGEECYFISMPKGELGVSILVFTIISIAIGVGTYLLTPKPNVNQNQLNLDNSPTYDLNQQGNRKRIGQPIPIHYGTIRAYPDICSNPYTVADNNDRIYHSLMCMGWNKIDVLDSRIDDTELTDFPWVEINVRNPGDAPTAIFPNPMITSKEVSGVLIEENGGADFYILNDRLSYVTEIYFDFIAPQGIYLLASGAPGYDLNCVVSTQGNIDLSYPDFLSIDGIGLFINDAILVRFQTNGYENGVYVWNGRYNPMTRHADIDQAYEAQGFIARVTGGTDDDDQFIQVNGVYNGTPPYEINSDYELIWKPYSKTPTFEWSYANVTAEIQEIDDLDADVGSPITKHMTLIGNTNKPLYFTETYTHPTSGRFKVKIDATGLEEPKYIDSESYMDRVEWIGFRGLIETAEPTHDDKTLIEISIQASDKLNNSNIGIFNFLGAAWIWVYDFDLSTWAIEQTNSPIWAFVDLVTSTRGDNDYGLSLPESRISLDNLEDIYDSISSLDLECNARFDTGMSGEEMVAQIASAMRCQSYGRGGVKYLARDEEKTSISAFFSRENIKSGSLQINWLPKSILSPNWYRITYFDEVTNKWETVDCVIPGDTPGMVEEVKLQTVTNRLKAWKEGMFYCAQNKYRRKTIKFTTDAEGFLPTILDHVSISHPILTHHQTGYVQKVDGATVYLSEPIAFDGYATALISFKKSDGTSLGPYICKPTTNQYSVSMIPFSTNAPDYTLFSFVTQEDESDIEPTAFTFGVSSSSIIGVVKQISASSKSEVSLECVQHDPRVHTADKPEHLMPDYSDVWALIDPFTCEATDCQYDSGTGSITTNWEASGYNSYVVRYLYDNNGTEELDEYTVMVGTHTYVNAYGTYPSRVTVTPIVDVTISPAVTEELTSLAVVIPIELI